MLGGDAGEFVVGYDEDEFVGRARAGGEEAGGAGTEGFADDAERSAGKFFAEQVVGGGRGFVDGFHRGRAAAQSVARVFENVDGVVA